jgi:hypothetical protein
MHDWAATGVPHPNSPAGQHFDWSSAGIPHPNSPAGQHATSAPKLTLKQRFVEVLKLTPNHMGPELAGQFRAMLTPSSLGMVAATFTALAISQAFGIGEVVDFILLLVGAYFVGMAVFTAAEDIVECVKTTVRAKSEADLDRAAGYLAQAVTILGVVAFFILIAKIGEKFGGAASAEEEGGAGAAAEEPPAKSSSSAKEASSADAEESAESASEENVGKGPTPEESELASKPGASPAQIAARQKVARSFYENAGMGPEDMDSHIACIDMNQPVSEASIPGAGGGPAGDQLYQWNAPGKTGQYFSTDPSVTPDQLGIDSNVASGGQVVPRVQDSFTATEPVTGLQSTAAPAVDTWSVPGQATQTGGGATQVFIPRGGQTGLQPN